MRQLRKILKHITADFDGCRYGFKYRKTWRVITNSSSLVPSLSLKCNHNRHGNMRGAALKASENIPMHSFAQFSRDSKNIPFHLIVRSPSELGKFDEQK